MREVQTTNNTEENGRAFFEKNRVPAGKPRPLLRVEQFQKLGMNSMGCVVWTVEIILILNIRRENQRKWFWFALDAKNIVTKAYEKSEEIKFGGKKKKNR